MQAIKDENWIRKNAPIDKGSAGHLLLSAKKIFDANDIPFLLVFGTLLRAYRNSDFIDYDSDVDIMVFDRDRPKMDELIDQGHFAIHGLTIVRRESVLYSFRYDNDYIDIYFFKEIGKEYRCGDHYIEKSQIDNGYSKIHFLGTDFYTVKNIEKYLEDKYGEDWRIPIAGKHAKI